MKGNVVLASVGEVAVKGARTRRRMQGRLLEAIEAALARWDAPHEGVSLDGGRVIVEGPSDVGRSVAALLHVFGVEKVSPAFGFRAGSLEDVAREAAEIASSMVVGKRFRVTARRVGRHGFTSMDVMRAVGALLREAGGVVSLRDYDVEVNVEVRGERAFVYTRELEGPGGLPEGTEGRVLALVSGGFDSPVAAWMLMRRGATVDFVFFNVGGEEHRRTVREVVCTLHCLYSYVTPQTLFDVELRWVFPLMEEVPVGVRGVYLKRAMYLAARQVASERGHEVIATGESLAQVSSQTLRNLVASERGLGIPVLRPLVGMDKREIVRRAMAIGTYGPSSRSREFCALATPRPDTAVDPDELDRYVARTGLEEAVREMVSRYTEALNLRSYCDCRGVVSGRLEELVRLGTVSQA